MTRPDALVGSTGLVGSTLARTVDFGLAVHSTDSDRLRGQDLGHAVFSAARAEKWRANADPAGDEQHIDALIDLLGAFRAERLTVVSTVDVFASPSGVDERTAPETAGLHPYGLGRLRLEEAARRLHPEVLVVRLPALFGPGLKKNVVYDLLHDNGVERIDPRSTFQWYDLTRLADDVDRAWATGQHLVHLVPQPVSTADVVRVAFGREPLAVPGAAAPVHYDVRSVVAEAFGGSGPYLEEAPATLERLRAFVDAERAS